MKEDAIYFLRRSHNEDIFELKLQASRTNRHGLWSQETGKENPDLVKTGGLSQRMWRATVAESCPALCCFMAETSRRAELVRGSGQVCGVFQALTAIFCWHTSPQQSGESP
jgi:hypothetical protein